LCSYDPEQAYSTEIEIELLRLLIAFLAYALGVTAYKIVRFSKLELVQVNFMVMALVCIYGLHYQLEIYGKLAEGKVGELGSIYMLEVPTPLMIVCLPLLFHSMKMLLRLPIFVDGEQCLRATLTHELSLSAELLLAAFIWIGFGQYTFYKMYQCGGYDHLTQKWVGTFLLF